jgi:hypothetical protein
MADVQRTCRKPDKICLSKTYMSDGAWRNVTAMPVDQKDNWFIGVSFNTQLTISESTIGCPTACVAQRAMRETALHARGVSKTRQL